jgi:exodeoxyribonuclease V beta subunit
MCGPLTPEVDGQPCGVFAWKPSAALVLELSDLLDGRLVPSSAGPRAGVGA